MDRCNAEPGLKWEKSRPAVLLGGWRYHHDDLERRVLVLLVRLSSTGPVNRPDPDRDDIEFFCVSTKSRLIHSMRAPITVTCPAARIASMRPSAVRPVSSEPACADVSAVDERLRRQ